jgi:hypothetical protein
MKKALVLFAFASLIAAQSFASYIVVLKGGKQYKAKAKWTVVNGKALIQLDNGQSITIDPALIDEAKSEETTKLGLGDVRIMNLDAKMPAGSAPKQAAPTLGESIKLRKPNQIAQAQQAAAIPTTAAPVNGSGIGTEVIMKFERAYENVGIFEHKLTSAGPHSIHAEVTADSEDKVFNAISATSFLMVRNAGVSGAQVDMVELFMKTTNGGSAGRFQMTRDDATALDAKTMSQQEYFVRKVIY